MIEDNKIVDLFWNREEDAIKVLDEKYGNDFQCLSVRIVNNYEDAEECVSDSYYKTWNSIPDARPASLYAYVGKIVRNLSINKLKGKTAQKRDENKVDKLVEELDLCAMVFQAMKKEETISYEAIICENLEEIANSYDTKILMSSNPYDYTDNEYYRNIVSLGFEAVPILMDKSEKKQISGVNSYVAAIAVQEITKCNLYEITGVDWETAEQFLELWNETMQQLPKQLKTIAENTGMTTADKKAEFKKYGIFGEAFLYETLVEGKRQFAGEKIEFAYTKEEKEKLVGFVKTEKKKLKKVVDYVESFFE